MQNPEYPNRLFFLVLNIDKVLWLALADITINKLYHGKQFADHK